MPGIKAGAVVFAGVATANVGNAIFHLIAGRWLGPTSYADVASLLALLGLVSFPLGAIQIALAQRVAHLAAQGDLPGIRSLYRETLGAAFVTGVLLGLGLGVAVPLISSGLDVDSTLAVALTAVCVIPVALAPVVSGLAQGLERFVLFSAAQVSAPIVRIAWLVPLLAAGAGVTGAVAATLAAAVISLAFPAWLLGGWWRRGGNDVAARSLRRLAGSLLPAVAGILAFTSLTTIDVIVAKLAFSDHDAGVYGGASLVGRLILYVPAAIAAVLLPKVSSRVALGARTTEILNGSLIVTFVFCLAATAVYAVAPDLILSLSFGNDYTQAEGFLWLFGVAMSVFALVNVLFIYDLGRGSARMSWILCAGAALQLFLFALAHSSPEALLAVDIVVASSLLAVGRFTIRSADT